MDPREILQEVTERTTVRALIASGQREPDALTDRVFFIRHPERAGRGLEPDETELVAEWRQIRDLVIEPELIAGPLPAVLDGVSEQAGAPPGAVISALAHCVRGLHERDGRATHPRLVVVHCTGGGPAKDSLATGGRRPAIEFALDVYLRRGPKAVWPHYVIDFNGAIYATCDEQERGRHAGWLDFGGAGFWTSGAWSPPAWWRAAWPDAATPVDLLPTDAASPNTDSIGIELLIHHQHYTHDQYVALARLIADLATRYPALRPTAAPEAQRLLGHEDVDPRTGEGGRANAGGGWDPGAHRDAPFFDWDRLWAELAPRLPS